MAAGIQPLAHLPGKVDANNNLLIAGTVSVTGAGSGGTSSVDKASFTAGTSAGTALMGVVDPIDTPADGTLAIAALDGSRNLKVNVVAGGAGGGAATVADGADVTLGAKADSGVGDSTGTLNAHSRQAAKVLSDVWDSTNHRVIVDGSGVTQPVSGTFWQTTQPVSAASWPLPTGAATAAKQPALGTAGSASSDVISIQGIASMTAVGVSAAALPLPSGASTAAKQPALGTAGSASADVLTIQGIASMTKLLVTPDANAAVNLGQVGGTSTDVNSGTKSNGTQRVVLATDQPALTNALKVDGSGVTQPVSQATAASLNATVIASTTLPVTLATVAIAASSSGDNTLLAAVSGKKTYVVAFELSFSGTVNAKFTDGASGTNLGGLYYGVANAGAANSITPPYFLFNGSTNTALILNLSGATAVGGRLTYYQL